MPGNIPDSIGKCESLEWLFLDQNSFEGSVPQSVKNLKGLDILNMTMNKMYGSIPDALCSVVGLQELYLAHNNFRFDPCMSSEFDIIVNIRSVL